MHIIWTIIIGFIAGVIAKFVTPGENEPSGFVLTTILGIIGAFLATYLGQAIGWYRADEGAGLIGAVVGAINYFGDLGFHCWSPSPVSLGCVDKSSFDPPRKLLGFLRQILLCEQL